MLQSGRMKQFIPQDGIYVYFRYNNEKTVMVMTNNNEVEKELEMKRFAEMLGGKTKATEITSGKVIDLNNVKIPAKSVWVMEL